MSRVRIAAAAITLLITLIFAVSALPSLTSGTAGASLAVAWAQLSGLLAILLMAVVVVLAARPRLLERPLDGLDKMYRLHKWLDVGAIGIGILHWMTATDGHPHDPRPGTGAATGAAMPPTPPAIVPTGNAILDTLASLGGAAHGVAQPALIALIALGAAALWQRIPYRWFAKTHILTVPAFLLLVFHSVVLLKTDYWSLPIGWLAIALLALAFLAAIHAVLHHAGMTRGTAAEVAETGYFPEIRVLETMLRVDPSWPGHKAGQFLFLTTDPREGAHPFTIASSWRPERGTIKLIAKELGDATARLRQDLPVGRKVRLEGPYGHFTFDDRKTRQIWIGAGIGITPFAARMDYLSRNPDGRTVDLFHATAQESREGLARLRADAETSGVNAHIIVSPRDGVLDFKTIADAVPDWQHASIWFCGPAGFGAALRSQFLAAGLSPGNWHQELFEMR